MKQCFGSSKSIIVFGPYKRNLRGQNKDFGGTKRVFGPDKQNLRGQNNDFGGTNDLEFQGTKQGFLGDQTMAMGGPKECLRQILS